MQQIRPTSLKKMKMNSLMWTRFKLNICCPIVMLCAIVVTLTLYEKCTIDVHGDVVNRSNNRIFFTVFSCSYPKTILAPKRDQTTRLPWSMYSKADV